MADDPMAQAHRRLEDLATALERVVQHLQAAQLDRATDSRQARSIAHAQAHIASARSLLKFSADRLLPDAADGKERIET